MALPKLNSSPKYELTIPSTNKTVRFRPFLVKEEKSLMIAMESGNQRDALNGLVDTILACTESDLDSNTLTTFDIEYIFLQLRAKSVGESTKIGLKCESCESVTDVNIMLDDIKVQMPEIDKHITFEGDIAVDLDWPSFNDLTTLDLSSANTETVFEIVANCIKTIHTGSERISCKESSKEDLKEFIESMNTEQFTKIKDFIDNVPRLKHDVTFTCKSCSTENKITVEGVESFLS